MAIETTCSAARGELKGLMDRVVEDREVVLVRRCNVCDVALERAQSAELTPLRLEDLEARLEA